MLAIAVNATRFALIIMILRRPIASAHCPAGTAKSKLGSQTSADRMLICAALTCNTIAAVKGIANSDRLSPPCDVTVAPQ
jgi:hypothetical protein